jgi:hypothetical protein
MLAHRVVLVGLVAFALHATLLAKSADAAPVSELEQALSALAAAAEQEESLSPGFKKALSDVVDALRVESEVLEPDAPGAVSAPADDSKTLLDRLHAFGDIRVRYEHESNRPRSEDRNRGRLRFRIGADYELTDELLAGFRVRTGNPDDPNSSHQALGGMFDSFEINLDRLYLRYDPGWMTDATGIATTVTAGKFGNPFVKNPVYGDLVWDADVNPEGLAGVFGYDFAEGSLRFTPAIYVLEEQSRADDGYLVTLQGSGEAHWDYFRARFASGWYRYFDLTPDGSEFSVRDNAGNLTCPDADVPPNGLGECYLSDFSIVDTLASLTWEGWKHPVTLAGELWVNTEAVNSDDIGYALGVKVGGKVNEQHDWRMFYQWQRVEQESLFSGFAQDDFSLATNFQGHVFGLSYGLARGIYIRPWVLMSEAIRTGGSGSFADDDLQTRLRVELNASF